MKLGKYISGTFTLVEVENGVEVTKKKEKRTEDELYADGYKKACPMEGEGEYFWKEYPTCFVQEWTGLPEDTEPEPEE